MKNIKIHTFALLLVFVIKTVSSQTLDDKFARLGLNTITTSVPFLLISPDTRAGGMGEAGVSTSPDANSIHWNPAKLGFVENDLGLSISYTPWLRQLVPDINLSYVSGYKRLDKLTTFGASLLYFSLGDIQFTDEYGTQTGQFRPNEFAIDVAVGRKLSEKLSGGFALRYINSNLTGSINVGGADSKPGRAVAADVSMYYEDNTHKLGDKKTTIAAGINISNIGNKMSYTSTAKRDFIPINLRIGPRYTVNLDDFNKVTLTVDINKLLVPTPPIYSTDSVGAPVVDSDGNYQIVAGKDPNRAVANGMFGSFNDAPGLPLKDESGNYIYNEDGITVKTEKGSVAAEEFREINYAIGLEYWYGKQFALRGGYFWEHQLKGNRKFFTLGAGLRYNVFGLDFSYLFPAYLSGKFTQKSPLQNTLRFTLTFDFAAFKKQSEEAVTN